MKFNHMYDVAFTCVSEQEDPYEVTHGELITALEKRLRDLKGNESGDAIAGAALGHCDSYEVTP